MAVEDKYVNSDVADGKLANPAKHSGADLQCAVVTMEVAAADDDGSVYRLIKGINAHLIPVKLDLLTDSIAGATDYDLGFYKTDLGAVVSKDCLMDGEDINAGGSFDGLQSVDAADRAKKVFELAGHTDANKLPAYDLCLTANTVGTAAGTITAILWFIQG